MHTVMDVAMALDTARDCLIMRHFDHDMNLWSEHGINIYNMYKPANLAASACSPQ